MAANFFSLYPKNIYQRQSFGGLLDTEGLPAVLQVELTDLFTRYRLKQAVRDSAALYYRYLWQDGDRPDTLAHKYYGASNNFWMVMLSNESADVNYDLPMGQIDFKKYLVWKYKDLVASVNGYAQTLIEKADLTYSRQGDAVTIDLVGNVFPEGIEIQLTSITGDLPSGTYQIDSASVDFFTIQIFDNGPTTPTGEGLVTITNHWEALSFEQKFILTMSFLQVNVREYQFWFEDNPDQIFTCTRNEYDYYTLGDYEAERRAAAEDDIFLPAVQTKVISLYDYEEDLNESKRAVSVLDQTYVKSLQTELTRDMNRVVAERQALGDI